MSEIVNKIKYAMSLRTPQEEALSYLDAISSHCDYKKDSKDTVETAATEYCEKQRKVTIQILLPVPCVVSMGLNADAKRVRYASCSCIFRTSL